MKHLSKEQRYTISVMYKENKTQTEMAKAIGVSKSTICRELKRNTRPHGKVYNHEEAHLVSQKRWRNSKKHVKLTEDMETLIRNMLRRLRRTPRKEESTKAFSYGSKKRKKK